MNNKLTSWTIFIALCLIWGTSFKLMHDGVQALSSVQVAALRIFSAGVVFIPFAFFHFSKLPRNKIGVVILSAVFGNLLPAFLFAKAVTKLDSSLVGILNSLTPICVVVIGIVFFKDRIKQQKLFGVLTGFLGLVLLTLLPVFLQQKTISYDNLGYTLLVVVATMVYGINVNMVAHYLKTIKPLHSASVSLAFMSIPAGLILWSQGFFLLDFSDPAVRHSIGAASLLGIAGSALATFLFYLLVQKAGALFASLVTYGIPFVALLWGFFDHEKITWIQVMCLGIILLGVYLANRKK